MSITCLNWRLYERNTLRGFADFLLSGLQLEIRDCAVHEKNDHRWVQFPARPQLDESREVVRNSGGKIQYSLIMRFQNREMADAFNRAALAAIDQHKAK